MTTKEIATLLGVTRGRVFQLVRSGELPASTAFVGRTRLWARADVEALAARREGRAVSLPAAALSPTHAPLPRVLDELIDYDPTSLAAHTAPRSVHLRVWDGDGPEGRRVVVLLGRLLGQLMPLDAVAEEVTRRLPVTGPDAVWFTVGEETPIWSPTSGAPKLDNVVLQWPPHYEAPRLPWSRRAMPSAPAALPSVSVRPANFADLDKLIGESVECYPAPIYTPETVRRFLQVQSGGTGEEAGGGHCVVDVVDDDIDFAGLCGTLSVLDHAAAQACTQDRDEHVSDAWEACLLVADEVRIRLPRRRALTNDGTGPGDVLPEVAEQRGAPQRWAARMVPVAPTAAEQELLDRYPGEFVLDGQLDQRHELLRRLWVWSDSIGEHADTPDPQTHFALERSTKLLAFYLRNADAWPAGAHRGDTRRPHRDTEPRAYPVRGRRDWAYLAGTTALPDPLATPNPTANGHGADLRRRARTLRALLLAPLSAQPLAPLSYRLDPHGHLVVHTDEPRGSHTEPWYAVEWPLRPADESMPDEALLVGDGGPGDLPVYIDWADGRLTPLPGRPDGNRLAQWNFGYSGAGPGALAQDIATALATADARDWATMPIDWIDATVCSRSQRAALRLSIGELRRHYPSSP